MFIRFGYDPDIVYHHVLKVPMDVYEGYVPDDHGIYADPCVWYQATEKLYISRYTEGEFKDYWANRRRICKMWSMRYLCD